MPLGVRVDVDTSPIPETIKETQKRSISLKACRAGAKIVNAAVKPRAPKRLGHLRRAQGVKAVRGKRGKTGSFAVQGVKTKYKKMVKAGRRSATAMRRVVPAFYDHLIIGGVKPHSIRKGAKLARKGKSAVGDVNLGRGTGKPHPGHSANPYRLRAYEGVRSQVNREMLRVCGVEVQKVLDKNAAKLRAKAKLPLKRR